MSLTEKLSSSSEDSAAQFEKPVLWCVAAEVCDTRKGNKWFTDLMYTHATCAAIARATYIQGLPNGEYYRVRIVGVAPVVGYFGDEKGQNITV